MFKIFRLWKPFRDKKATICSLSWHRLHEFLTGKSAWYLAMDLVGSFVVAQAEKHGMTQPAIGGPFGETDLANQHWQQPRAAAHLGPT